MSTRAPAVVCLLLLGACGGSGDGGAAEAGAANADVPLRWVTGEELAHPVPSDPVPGRHVNDVPLRLDGDGGGDGAAWAEAGTPVRVRVTDDESVVRVRLDDGRTASGDRDEFWVIPDFISLGDADVVVGGRRRPVVSTDMEYRRVRRGDFDDPGTPRFEGIASNGRRFLRCESDEWKIANQYFAADLIADGVYARDRELVDLGVQALDWGVTVPTFDEQGVFSLHRRCDGTTLRDPGETHHSTQWFVGLGRGTLLLAASPFAGEYRTEIDRYARYVEDFARILTRPDVRDHWVERWVQDPVPGKGVFTHKYFMRAAGLSLAALVTDDLDDAARWEREAWEMARAGMDEQRDDGVYPERGGLDVRYQGYGTWLASVYYSTLDDGPRKEALEASIDRSVEWLVGRIDPESGAIDLEGSTRTCVDPETVGQTEYHPYHTLSVLLLWGELTDRAADMHDVAVLHDAEHRRTGTPCLRSLRN